MSESMPHLKLGVIRDFETILKEENEFDESKINYTEHVYFFNGRKSYIEFFSADNAGKVHGPRRDILFLNECNNISFKVFDQLFIRTEQCTFLDYNPSSQFWVDDEVIAKTNESKYAIVHSTYLDNIFLTTNQRERIEARKKTHPEWFKVYGLGMPGNLEGVIFPSINIVEEMPAADRQSFGMDFGFTNDPTTLVDVRLHGGELFIDELLYRTSMTGGDIISFLKSENIDTRKRIIADNEDMRLIKEISDAGYSIEAATKGPGSIRAGIDLMMRYKINVTRRSVNAIKEFRNYTWRVDKSGRSLNEPVDYFNHCIDPVRYAMETLTSPILRAPKIRY